MLHLRLTSRLLLLLYVGNVTKELTEAENCPLTNNVIDLISQCSTFAIGPAIRRCAIFVERVGGRSIGRAPSTILNCKNGESTFLSCSIAFCDGVVSCPVVTIQDRILPFQCFYGRTLSVVIETTDFFVRYCKIN